MARPFEQAIAKGLQKIVSNLKIYPK